jgi:hypothetical protein
MPNENSARELDDSGSHFFFFNLTSARLAPIVALASTSFANPAFSYLAVVPGYLLVHLGVFNRQEVRRLRSHCSSTLYKAHIRGYDRPPDI